jgi:tripartite motif-containing protein 71
VTVPFSPNGEKGRGNGQFELPGGVAVDRGGKIIVADSGNNRIQVFSGDGTFLTKWGSEGKTDGQLKMPHSVGVDGEGNILVCDSITGFKFSGVVKKIRTEK